MRSKITILLSFISLNIYSQDFYDYYSIEVTKQNLRNALENKDINLHIYWSEYLYNKLADNSADTSNISNLILIINSYQQIGLYKNSEVYLDKAQSIARKYTNPKRVDALLIDKINSRTNAIQIKSNLFLKQISKANKYAKQLAENLVLFGSEGSQYPESYLQLARYYIYTNDYFRADSLLQIRFNERSLNTNQVDIPQELIAEVYKAYGELYFATKNRAKSVAYFELAKRKYVEMYDVHIDLVQIEMSIGTVKMENNNFSDANIYFESALDLLRRKFGKISRLYAEALSLMAQSYDLMGYENTNFVKSLHLESLKIYNILKIDNELDYSLSFHRWIEHFLFYSQEDSKVAVDENEIERAIQKTQRNITRELGSSSIESINASCNSAYWYFQNTKPEKGAQLLLKSNESLSKKVFEQTSFLTENEQVDLINFIKNKLNINHSYAFHYANLFPELTIILYDNFLILKGLLVTSNNLLLKGGKQYENSKIVNDLYDEYKSKGNKLAVLLAKKNEGSTREDKRIADLSSEVEQINKALVRILPSFQLINPTLSKNWKDIRDSLKTSEAVIEFINFDYFNPDTRKRENKNIYCALLLKKDYSFPKVFKLFEEQQLVSFLDTQPNEKKDDESYVRKVYQGRGMIKVRQEEKPITSTKIQKNTPTKVKKQTKEVIPKQAQVESVQFKEVITEQQLDKEALYKLTWLPFERELSNVENIYFSPIGILHKISFPAIQSNNKYLIDDFNLVQVSSTRVLLERNKQNKFENNWKSVLFGGIDFNESDYSMNRGFQTKNNSTLNKRNVYEWGELKGSSEEVKEISQRLTSSTVFEKDKATETEFKNISSKAFKLVHVATHGYFLDSSSVASLEVDEEQSRLSFFSSDNPLLRSGLIFAGGNYIWKNGVKREEKDPDDGVLTALELSSLDLSNVELMVLSACKTGLGDVKNTEGVYGLQRALKMSGVKSYIISLWEVPDKETKEMMLLFYNNLIAGGSIEDSLLSAQREMRKKYDPFYWAAFVLVK